MIKIIIIIIYKERNNISKMVFFSRGNKEIVEIIKRLRYDTKRRKSQYFKLEVGLGNKIFLHLEI